MAGSRAFGEQNPTQGETAVSWQTWSDGAGNPPTVTGDADWGKLKLELSGEEGRSAVYDLGSAATRTFTLTENRYGAGTENAVLQYRTDTDSFAQDDATPAWTDYTAPFSVNCRYVQIRETTNAPDWDRTIQFIGDLHFGAITASRAQKVIDDAAALPMPAAHVLMGDITNTATVPQDNLALAFIGDLPATVYAIAGSHDIWGDARTPAEWAVVYSMPAADYIVDLTFCKLICVSQVSAISGKIDAGRLTWIENALTAASPTPCLICFHFPLYDTTLSSDPVHYLSTIDTGWTAYTDSAIRAMLAAHSNAIGWVQAHIHAPYNAPQFISSGVEGTHTMAYISVSSPYYTDMVTGENLLEAVVSVYVTIPASGSIRIGVRDHLTQTWLKYYAFTVG